MKIKTEEHQPVQWQSSDDGSREKDFTYRFSVGTFIISNYV
jgi:hypothetical protein